MVDVRILIVGAQSKVESLAEQHPVMLDSLVPKVRKRVEALRAIQVPLFLLMLNLRDDSCLSPPLFLSICRLYILFKIFVWR